MNDVPNSPFKPLVDGWGIQPITGTTPLGGGLHDTFRTDVGGSISGGHTTVQIPGGQKVHLPW